MIKKVIVFALLFAVGSFGQTPAEKYGSFLTQKLSEGKNELLHVWIFFSDKGEDTEGFFREPNKVVSEKSLERRAKVMEKSLITFEDLPVNENYIDWLVQNGFEIKHRSRWFNAVSGYIKSGSLSNIASKSFVKKLEVVRKFKRIYEAEDPNPIMPESPQQPADVQLDYGYSFDQNNQINVPAVHNLGYTGEGVTICVMDAGFNNLTHESFDSMNIVAAWDFVNNDGNVDDENDMGTGNHGTNVLSVIGGFKEGKMIGPAFRSDYLLAKTENTDSETPVEEDNWVAAMEWADSIGVDVTSTSLGYLDYDAPFASYTWEDMDGNTALITRAGDIAASRGIVVVTSAGNNGFNSSHNTLGAPADGDSVIAVGAVTSGGNRSSFSSVGNTVDGRIKPDIMAMGSQVTVASAFNNTFYGQSNGTSFSCPLAAGVAALILSANPYLSPMEVRDAMRNTASNSTTPNREYGWGILDALEAISFFPVPVELESFEGNYDGGKISLVWSTSTESNNRGFEIERSSDKKSWLTIGFVAGNGTTTEKVHYSFTDIPSYNGVIYYRLKQLDYDGSFEYSKTIEINAAVVNEFKLYGNYPNPFNPETQIGFTIPQPGKTELFLYDILGNKISELVNQNLDAGYHEVRLNGSGLASGIYIVILKNGNNFDQIKINLLK